MQTKTDLIDALRDRAYSFKVPDKLVAQAADEIERLRRLTRFQDNVIRSGDVACLTKRERAALEVAADDLRHADDVEAIRGLLARMGAAP